jgi:hypothetical protein
MFLRLIWCKIICWAQKSILYGVLKCNRESYKLIIEILVTKEEVKLRLKPIFKSPQAKLYLSNAWIWITQKYMYTNWFLIPFFFLIKHKELRWMKFFFDVFSFTQVWNFNEVHTLNTQLCFHLISIQYSTHIKSNSWQQIPFFFKNF